jgi:hypothetical protein
MTKIPMTWMHMLEPVQRSRRGPIQMEMRAAHGWPDRLPECCGPDLGCHPENEEFQPSCPRCDSPHLEYGFHFATHQQDLEGEVAHCRACGWTGEAEETQPVLQPKPMGRAVAGSRWPAG